MKTAIISDTHDNLATLDKFIAFARQNKIKTVIHCGDIASGETIKRLADNFDGKIFAVFGNMDYRESVQKAAKKFPDKIHLFNDFGQTKISGLKIGFCHHKETALVYCENQTAKTLKPTQEKKYDFIFYGHTHKPWLETSNDCQLANPGTLAGMFYSATFATLDTKTKKLELKIIARL